MTEHSPQAQELKKELGAALDARRELGPEYEAALVDSFVEKVETQVRRRLAEERLQYARGGSDAAAAAVGNFGERFGFAIVTLVLAVPLSAIAATQAHLSGLIVCWLGILGVNFVHARKDFLRRDAGA
ncbi:hypothetical protein ACIRP0_12265 [Streptomyces sp. NPDC101733]|uniref:hypothetical protein n=1 Tax=unclassified Streptomyces TaxID=2593676 RepID=UPI0037F59FE8